VKILTLFPAFDTLQWQYRELLVARSHENQLLQMQLAGLRNNSFELQDCVLRVATLMDQLREKQECAERCNAAVDGLRRVIREVHDFRTSSNVELQVLAIVSAGLSGMGLRAEGSL
jgi:hypothetical protein